MCKFVLQLRQYRRSSHFYELSHQSRLNTLAMIYAKSLSSYILTSYSKETLDKKFLREEYLIGKKLHDRARMILNIKVFAKATFRRSHLRLTWFRVVHELVSSDFVFYNNLLPYISWSFINSSCSVYTTMFIIMLS